MTDLQFQNESRRALLNQTAVVIFASRESLATLIPTIVAARVAADKSATIEVLVNGNSRLADDLAGWLNVQYGLATWKHLRVWSIPDGDKANAWTQYFHKIWSGEDLVFFSDGYVRIRPDSIRLLSQAMAKDSYALGGSGVPSTGRTATQLAAEMIKEGGFAGGFCCVRGSVIAELRQRQFRIPLGLYRTDSLVGAVLTFGLDPKSNEWDTRRICVHPHATWDTPPKYWWHYKDLVATLKRKLRQARGMLENAAVKNHLEFRRQPPEFLPATATEMVTEWMARCPADARAIIRFSPLARVTVSSFNNNLAPGASTLAPKLRWPL